jgi:hypothetical protein
LFDKINNRREREEERGLVEWLHAQTLKDANDGIDVSLFNDESILELDDLRLRQSNREHITYAELGECLLVKQGLSNLFHQ